MTTDVHDVTLEAVPAAQAPQPRTWREKRWERRRRRLWLEEALGWILVPLIVLGLYFLVDAVLGALGTSVPAIVDGIRMIVSTL